MKTSTFERAMVQNANTTPLRHEQLGGAHCPQCGRLGHACTTHSTMGSTMHTASGGVITALGIGALVYFGNNRTSRFVPLMVAGLGGLAVGGYLQNK